MKKEINTYYGIIITVILIFMTLVGWYKLNEMTKFNNQLVSEIIENQNKINFIDQKIDTLKTLTNLQLEKDFSNLAGKIEQTQTYFSNTNKLLAEQNNKLVQRISFLQDSLLNIKQKNFKLNNEFDRIISAKDSVNLMLMQYGDSLAEVLKSNQEIKSSFLAKKITLENEREATYLGGVNENGEPNGYGSALYRNGDFYTGYWKNNQKHGEGLFEWENGDKYEGKFKNNKREGQGTYYWRNGDVYKGEWKNNKRHGFGVIENKRGKEMFRGTWENDKFVQPENLYDY